MPHEQSVFMLCFIGMGFMTHRSCGSFLVSSIRCSAWQRKGRTMRIPKTPVEFDYDLWTTEDGKCMVRVKRTGEVTEVDRDVMRILRAEEKRIRRSYGADGNAEQEEENESHSNSILSLDSLPDDDVKSSTWLADPNDFLKEFIVQMQEEAFIDELTEREKDVYFFCIKDACAQQDYADQSGLSVSRVSKIIAAIRKKAKKFF